MSCPVFTGTSNPSLKQEITSYLAWIALKYLSTGQMVLSSTRTKCMISIVLYRPSLAWNTWSQHQRDKNRFLSIKLLKQNLIHLKLYVLNYVYYDDVIVVITVVIRLFYFVLLYILGQIFVVVFSADYCLVFHMQRNWTYLFELCLVLSLCFCCFWHCIIFVFLNWLLIFSTDRKKTHDHFVEANGSPK